MSNLFASNVCFSMELPKQPLEDIIYYDADLQSTSYDSEENTSRKPTPKGYRRLSSRFAKSSLKNAIKTRKMRRRKKFHLDSFKDKAARLQDQERILKSIAYNQSRVLQGYQQEIEKLKGMVANSIKVTTTAASDNTPSLPLTISFPMPQDADSEVIPLTLAYPRSEDDLGGPIEVKFLLNKCEDVPELEHDENAQVIPVNVLFPRNLDRDSKNEEVEESTSQGECSSSEEINSVNPNPERLLLTLQYESSDSSIDVWYENQNNENIKTTQRSVTSEYDTDQVGSVFDHEVDQLTSSSEDDNFLLVMYENISCSDTYPLIPFGDLSIQPSDESFVLFQHEDNINSTKVNDAESSTNMEIAA